MPPHPDPQWPVKETHCVRAHPGPSECPSPAGLMGGGGLEPQARRALGEAGLGAAVPYYREKADTSEAM